ncbi:MAG: S1C family serine protease [Anaerolineae bacterium]
MGRASGVHFGMTLSRSPRSGTLVLTVVIGILLATAAGGITGAVVGMRAAQSQSERVALPPSSTTTPEPPAPSEIVQVTLSQDSAIVAAVEEIKPAVVTVVTSIPGQDFLGRRIEQEASGSGVIISDRGYIVTNDHVVRGGERYEVIFSNGTAVEATLVGTDFPFTDLAVLRVSPALQEVAEWGDSEALKPGEPVIAIGSPLGDLRGTVTVGVVSALDRSVSTDQGTQMEGLIQTDAAINPGNSGGPLVNILGQVVGINTAIRVAPTGAEGLGFSIPSSIVQLVADQLIAQGFVSRPYLGIRSVTITRSDAVRFDLPAEHGVFVEQVVGNTPAARAGIQERDIITTIDGQPIGEENPLITVLMRFEVGQTVTLTVYRNGREIQLPVTLGLRPQP